MHRLLKGEYRHLRSSLFFLEGFVGTTKHRSGRTSSNSPQRSASGMSSSTSSPMVFARSSTFSEPISSPSPWSRSLLAFTAITGAGSDGVGLTQLTWNIIPAVLNPPHHGPLEPNVANSREPFFWSMTADNPVALSSMFDPFWPNTTLCPDLTNSITDRDLLLTWKT